MNSELRKINKGDKYNRLTAIKFSHIDKWYIRYWLFKCDCGNEKVIAVSSVKNGATKSCGCLNIERIRQMGLNNKTHKLCNSLTYRSWSGMKSRCFNKKDKGYENWGGCGITVCKRWMKFENFYADMGKRPSKKHSIDRIDNKKGYSKENCRWATQKEQQNNMRSNIFVSANGVKIPFSELAEMFGINYYTLHGRIFRDNLDLKKALNQ